MPVSARWMLRVPLTHTGSMVFKPATGLRAITWIIWLAGGGGTWMQAPK
jgi:hypothetical protein